MRTRIRYNHPIYGGQTISTRGGFRARSGPLVRGAAFRDWRAAEFNNGVTNEYAYCDNPSFASDQQGAISFWYRPLTVLSSAGVKGIWGFGTTGASNAMLSCLQRWNSGATINATYRSKPIIDMLARKTNAGATTRAYGDHIFAANTWVHVIVQSNGSAWTYFVNGTAAGGTGWAGEANTGDWFGDVTGGVRFIFGGQWVSNAFASVGDQRVNEACYFNRALTSAEASWLYNGGVPRNPRRGGFGTDLKSWWRFGDSRDNGTTIYDEIGSNNLTLVNMDTSNYVAP